MRDSCDSSELLGTCLHLSVYLSILNNTIVSCRLGRCHLAVGAQWDCGRLLSPMREMRSDLAIATVCTHSRMHVAFTYNNAARHTKRERAK